MMLDACPHHPEDPRAAVGEAGAVVPPRYWQSIDQWMGTPEFEQVLHREFPPAASEWHDETSRRSFMKLMAASAAMAGLSGCFRKPTDKIVPYVHPPEQLVPGVALNFATALSLDGFARGAVVRSNEGRPTKVEGNPDHPASLGATDVFMQAAILEMYDPDRSQIVINRGNASSWEAFSLALTSEMEHLPPDGNGLRVLGSSFTSPTLARHKRDFLTRYPAARWHQYDPVGRENARAGARTAFGTEVDPVYSFDRARIILSLDSDFLLHGPAAIRHARHFIDGRRVRINDGNTSMNRLYVVESTPSITGAMADYSLRVRPSRIETMARAIFDRLRGRGGEDTDLPWLNTLLQDLQANRGASLVVAGEWQSPAVHALAHAMNDVLGNAGKTVSYIDPVVDAPAADASLKSLSTDIAADKVKTLLILGCNPVYDAPVDLNLAERMNAVPLRIHHGLREDETGFQCHWHLPATHEFEHWSDARAFDGTASIVQPLIAPLYEGRSVHHVLSLFLGKSDQSDYEAVRETWKAEHKGSDFETFWRNALNRGVIDGTTSPARSVTLQSTAVATQPSTAPAAAIPADEMEIAFRPDPSLWDGRFANNGWLMELPKPLTKLTWDNAFLLSPATAERLDADDGRMFSLAYQGRMIQGPLLVMPGHPDDTVTVHLGFGRTRAGRVGNGHGFNAYSIRTSDLPWGGVGVTLRKLDGKYDLAVTQRHQNMEGRDSDLVRVHGINEYLKEKTSKEEKKSLPLSLYTQRDYDKPGTHKWGMSIDNNACIGCNACVIACVAENNIPVVGKEQVLSGREMHWLRIDTYYTGDFEKPGGPYFEPIPCMHCEQAPCEVVCPVAATTHSAEGINEMTYNRCVGTRYCSNNCPYKVRHFNFFQYADLTTESLKLARNPEVTVRNRGVMEKCNYCIQRINNGRIRAKICDSNNQPEQAKQAIMSIQTACQQSCPTNAIVFGDLNLNDMEVVKLKDEPGNYALLEELNTRPRTTYLPRLTNKESGNGDVL